MIDIISILEKALPVFIMLGLGMLCRKINLLSREGVNTLKSVAVNITLPAVMFSAFAAAEYTPASLFPPLVIFVCCVLMLLLGMTACTSSKSETYTVGICQLVQHEALDAATKGFRDALVEALGEENVTFDEQNAAGDSNTCSTIVNSFVSQNVDLIMANATPALQAAAAATLDIPILGTSVTEYGVALGIENFSGTVGGNISGTSDNTAVPP